MVVTQKSEPGLPGFPAPFWAGPACALYLGDVRNSLRTLPTRSVHCAVTSPPYWGLRDYQIDAQLGMEPVPDCLGWATGARCGLCYVCHMVEVFDCLRRVLRDDGTCWLNLGDTYASGEIGRRDTKQGRGGEGQRATSKDIGRPRQYSTSRTALLNGNLVGIPWRVASALQADGWVLRNDIIWAKPNPMIESVTSRCTKSHEYIFLLTKGMDYYYDKAAIEDSATPVRTVVTGKCGSLGQALGAGKKPSGNAISGSVIETGGTRNKRDVWTVSTDSYPGAHFAVYPPRLITPCILAGTSEYGCCAGCGKPWERVVAPTGEVVQTQWKPGSAKATYEPTGHNKAPSKNSALDSGFTRVKETVGWRKTCGCRTDDVLPCTVLDPFVGSGTTVATAIELGRAGTGIDLSETYLKEHAIPRIEAAIRGEKMSRKHAQQIVSYDPPPIRKLPGD